VSEWLQKVTRVEVIDSTGRVFSRFYEAGSRGVYLELQDDDRTLKVFAGQPDEETN